jgi:NTP pyrophosphatase (non-canonical NTP hydrolase)
MNINDVENDVTLPAGLCRLDMIFAQQMKLMEKYKEIEAKNLGHSYDKVPVDIHSCAGQQKLKDLAQRTIEEICEATSCLKNKPWKSTHMVTDVAHFEEEMADALHFFVEMCIHAGIDADRLFKLYFRKSLVNGFRQRSNY